MSKFNISYRLMDDFEYISKLDKDGLEVDGGIEGFFKISGGNFEYGYYHENDLYDGEEGPYYIDLSLNLISQAVLKLSQNNYVAMQDIEFTNKWLEFVKENDSHICIYKFSLDSSIAESGPIITHKIQRVNRSREVLKTNLEQIITSIVDAIEKYMVDALSINPLFRDTSRINSLIELKSKLINLNLNS